MIKMLNGVIDGNVRERILSKTLAFFVAVFIAFNCVSSSLTAAFCTADLSEISVVQKDVFSAIFLISNAIEKVNDSLAVKLGVKSPDSQSSSGDDSRQPARNASDDVIITAGQIQNIKIIKNLYAYCLENLIYGKFCLIGCVLSEKSARRNTGVTYLLEMLLFFASDDKTYNIFKTDNNFM